MSHYMGAKEKSKINEILLNLPDDERLFRANSGQGWVGKVLNLKPGSSFIFKKGMVVLINARAFHGMETGFPDLVGWKTIEITPDMVGNKIAVFTGKEVKTGKLKETDDQSKFGNLINRMGGIFRVLR